jgi:KDO2-lipid IV(A) lauroyltransferase
MRKFLYYIYAAPIYAFTLLPFPLFYFVCDIFYIITYYLVGYRKKVVYTNLRNAFPEKTEKEIDTIAKRYYHFMIDLFMETFKMLTMTEKQLLDRVVINDLSIVEDLKSKNKNYLFVMGHFGNWEWGGQSYQLRHIYEQDVLYHPLKSEFFEWLMLKVRTRFGIRMVPMNTVLKVMVQSRNKVTSTCFIADQTPTNIRDAYWTTFLNQDTPVYFGTEKIAKRFNYPVVFVSIFKERRGYYQAYLKLICDDSASTPDGFITEAHTRLLEEDIKKQPEIWLWSHRRWKHKRT